MGSTWTMIGGAFVLVAATTLVTSEVVSQQNEDPAGQADAMWEHWMKLAQPGEEHARFARAAGKWKQHNTHWMYPGAEPQTSEAMAEIKPILGGRFMLEKMRGTGEMNGHVMEFEGLGIFGFDNLTQRHTFVWLDNHGTMMMLGEGAADVTGNVITYLSEMPNPMGEGTMTFKSVSTIVSDDEQTFEMFQEQPDGTWFRNMKAVAHRQR